MPSTFFGLNIASSALSAFQTAVNTTANNISNTQTNGYTRQVANRRASDELRVNQAYGSAGSGVTTTSIKSMRDSYYDNKYWQNQSSYGLYNTKLNYLNQIENYLIDDETQEGFSSIFDSIFNSLDALTGNASDTTVRTGFVSNSSSLASYFNMVSTGLSQIQKDANEQIRIEVDSINSIAQKIASLNLQINNIEMHGGTANELRDQRALLVDQLSEIVPVTVSENEVVDSNNPGNTTGATTYVIKLNGQTLVNTYDYRTLSTVSRDQKVNQSDVDGLYDIVWSDTKMDFSATSGNMSGNLKGLFEIRDGNNSENFQGTVKAAVGSTITIAPSTMSSVESMALNPQGYLTIAGKKYEYSGFTANLDAEGNITSYTFELAEGALDAAEASTMPGSTSQIGETISSKGVPYYMAQMNEFLRSFVSRFNAYQQSGVDLNGNQAGSFFIAQKTVGGEYDFADQSVTTDGATAGSSVITSSSNSYYMLTAANIAVASDIVKDPSLFSTTASIANGTDAYDIAEAMLSLKSDVKLFRGGTASDFLQNLLSDVSVDVQENTIFYDNYTAIGSSITNQRLSIAGVDQDEEALDLLKYQNAYNLASRMTQTMSEMFDRLILETGV
ncbi:MAG: flagellar hook-associated protein FlgK [Lachnospiraceae bacterium]